MQGWDIPSDLLLFQSKILKGKGRGTNTGKR
jgi:hypothetical protein